MRLQQLKSRRSRFHRSTLRWILAFGIALALGFLAGSALAVPVDSRWAATTETAGPLAFSEPKAPDDLQGTVVIVSEGAKAAQEGRWWHLGSLACLLVMFILSKAGLLTKMGRWRFAVLPALAIGSALLATFQGGVSIDRALSVFMSSWATGMLEEAWTHGVKGRPHKNV